MNPRTPPLAGNFQKCPFVWKPSILPRRLFPAPGSGSTKEPFRNSLSAISPPESPFQSGSRSATGLHPKISPDQSHRDTDRGPSSPFAEINRMPGRKLSNPSSYGETTMSPWFEPQSLSANRPSTRVFLSRKHWAHWSIRRIFFQKAPLTIRLIPKKTRNKANVDADVAELPSIQPASTHTRVRSPGRSSRGSRPAAGRARHSEGLRSHVKTGHDPRQALTHSDRDSAGDPREAISTPRA